MKNKKKYIIINILLFALLYFMVEFNKEYIRPTFGHIEFIKIISGSLPNFLAALVVPLFSVSFVLSKIKDKKRIVFFLIGVIIFSILTIEEYISFAGASKIFDKADIIANGIGVFIAILIFEIILRKTNKNKAIS